MSRVSVLAPVDKCSQEPKEQKTQNKTSEALSEEEKKAQARRPILKSSSLAMKCPKMEVRQQSEAGQETKSMSINEVEKHYALEPCRGCPLGCTGMSHHIHCPLCPTEKYKPTSKAKVLAHIMVTHGQSNWPKVSYKEFRIRICNLRCMRLMNRHYHCCFCQSIIPGKAQILPHFYKCFDKQERVIEGAQERVKEEVQMGEMQVRVKEEEMQLMEEGMLERMEEREKEVENGMQEESSSVSRTLGAESIETEQVQSPAVTPTIVSRGVNSAKRKLHSRRQTPPGLETITVSSDEVEKHYALEPCRGCSLGCTGMKDQVHCPVCPSDKFKPTRRIKVLAHIVTAHCQDNIPTVTYKGSKMSICRLFCGSAKRSHYHCCMCQRALCKKDQVIPHVSRCFEKQQEDEAAATIEVETIITEGVQPQAPGVMNIKVEPVKTEKRQYVKRIRPPGLKSISISSGEIEKHYTLEPCQGCPLGCTGMSHQVHCPLCSINKYKPTRKIKVLAHITSAHCQENRPAVTYKDKKMPLCCESCGTVKRSHYHCCFCRRILCSKYFVSAHVTRCPMNNLKGTTTFRKMKNRVRDNLKKGRTVVSTVPVQQVNPEKPVEQMDTKVPTVSVKQENCKVPKIPVKPAEVPTVPKMPGGRGYSSSVTKQCPECHKRYHSNYLKFHIRTMHNSNMETKKKISANRYHHSVCIDATMGLYSVSRVVRGPQHPIHVVYKVESEERRMECSLTTCQELLQTEWRSGNSEYRCPHLQSVPFSQLSAVPCDMDQNQLSVALGISESRVGQLRGLCHEAERRGSQLMMEVPGRPHASMRFRWFSVYTGKRQFQWWCKFGRTVVMADTKTERVTCQCKTWACLHVGVVRWWLGLGAGEDAGVSIARPKKEPKLPKTSDETQTEIEDKGPSEEELQRRKEEALTRTVEYLSGPKSIEASALLQVKFDPSALPETFSPSETECVYCCVALDPLHLITRRVKVLVRGLPPLLGCESAVRTCGSCHMEYRYQEWQHGVYNYDNKLFLSIPLLLTIRAALARNITVSSVVGLLEDEVGGFGGVSVGMVERAYMSFEAVVVHYYNYSCVRCGYHPKILVLASNKAATFHYSSEASDDGGLGEGTVDTERFWSDVQKELVSRGVVEEGHPNPFRLTPSPHRWAPYLGPHTRAGPHLHNTEGFKAGRAWDAEGTVGDDVVLNLLAVEKVEIVRRLCRKLELETSGTKLELLNKIAAVPKVLFDNAYTSTFNISGGWVTAQCPHGVTYAAKCLLRQETPSDTLDILHSFKHVPTVTISEQADAVAQTDAVSQAAHLFPTAPLFMLHQGRLLEATEQHMKDARSRSLLVSLPTIAHDCPPAKCHPGLHPTTGLAERYCLFDWYHHRPLKTPEDCLRRASIVKELASYTNSQASKHLYRSKLGHEMNHFSSQVATYHLFCFRLATHLQNERINQDEVVRQSKNLSGVTLNDLGQLVRCDAVDVNRGNSSPAVNLSKADGVVASGVLTSDKFQDKCLERDMADPTENSSPAMHLNISGDKVLVKINGRIKVPLSDIGEAERSYQELSEPIHSNAPTIYLDKQSDMMVSYMVNPGVEIGDPSNDDNPVILIVE